MKAPQRHLLGIEELSRGEIENILARALEHRRRSEGEGAKPLSGKLVANLFFEDSTRTRSSFEVAARVLGAEVLSWSPSGSSVSKGETLIDTVRTVEAIGADIIIIRHSSSGVPRLLSRYLRCSIVNAGDGIHEHPSQALLDAFTLREHLGRLDGKRVLILGDILHSRVARSNIHCLGKLGVEVMVGGPPTLLPAEVERLGCRRVSDFRAELPTVDAVMMLRIQRERLTDAALPSLREYAIHWGLDAKSAAKVPKGAIILHPGPINRGVEVSTDVADSPQSAILEQVSNGLAVRMAILEMIA